MSSSQLRLMFLRSSGEPGVGCGVEVWDSNDTSRSVLCVPEVMAEQRPPQTYVFAKF